MSVGRNIAIYIYAGGMFQQWMTQPSFCRRQHRLKKEAVEIEVARGLSGDTAKTKSMGSSKD